MRPFRIIFCFIFCYLFSLYLAEDLLGEEIKRIYEEYLTNHSKPIIRISNEQRVRKFHERYSLVNKHNHDGVSYKLELNEFSDLFEDEIKSYFSHHLSPSFPDEFHDKSYELQSDSRAGSLLFSNKNLFHARLQSFSSSEGIVLNWATDENPFKTPLTGQVHYQVREFVIPFH
jgi:hypothetical protein